MLVLEPKAASISKSNGTLSIQTPLEVVISYENSVPSIDEERISIYSSTKEDDLIQEEFWQAYLASEQEWEEVYRRLAES
ncbi:MAG: hypothetical protein NW224_01580 [Leptolyngbyaceae cyanobacterium bins.302]|nr:hypothetical protein [Leptolyngbyaceae cyanobacterium bins.302]